MPCWAGRDCKSTASGLQNPESRRGFQTDDGPASRSAPCGYSARHKHSAAAVQAGVDVYAAVGGPGQRHGADVLRAVIAANDLGFATPFDDPVEAADDAFGRQ